MKKKKVWIPLSIILLLVIAFFSLPALILHDLNSKGATGSKTVITHIQSLTLTFPLHFKMENLTVKMRSNGVTIFEGKHSRVGIDWKRLKEGRLLFWADLRKYALQYAPEYAEGLTEVQKYMFNPKPTIKFSDIGLHDSSIVISRYGGVSKDKYFTLHDLTGSLKNLQPTPKEPELLVKLTAKIYGETHLMLDACFKNLIEPKEWDLDFVLEKMRLPDLNLVLKKELPIIFKSGTLDVYAEAQSKKGSIRGYIKPFLNEVVIDENDPSRKHPGHMILSFFANIFEDKKLKSFSTRIPIIMEGPFELDYSEIFKNVYKKGLKNNETRGLEHSVGTSR